VAIVSSESFADSSLAGIFERHVLCVQIPIYISLNLPLRPAAVGCNLQ